MTTAQHVLKEAHLRREQARQARYLALRCSCGEVAGKLGGCALELDQIATELESWASIVPPQ
jgi:hypothetical protein